MKTFLALFATLCAFNASAISFFSEEDVRNALDADNVIEIRPRASIQKILPQDSACYTATFSKSSRAYIVKKGRETALFVTTSELKDLMNCGAI